MTEKDGVPKDSNALSPQPRTPSHAEPSSVVPHPSETPPDSTALADSSCLRPWDFSLEYQAIASPSSSANPYGSTKFPRPQAESISVASVWQMESTQAADEALAGEGDAFVYRRDGHPNERTLAEKLALLHAATKAVITAQGMSAIGAVALATLSPGSQVWIGDELYGKSSKLFSAEMNRWNVSTRSFDVTSKQAIAELRSSRVDLVLIETLSNPRLRVPDVANIAEATHLAGGQLLVDNTFATHLLCQPLTLGADLVIESLSKQVNGHSDSMLGMVAGKNATNLKRIQDVVSTFGLASSPLDCYLTHRGLMSLAVRMERACKNAMALATALNQHPAVETVDYPGLAHHPQHRLATEQLRGGYGWMLSFRLNANQQQLQQLLDRLKPEIQFVPSLGDVCTTISHPASTSHRSISTAMRDQLGIGPGTIRVSCGIEPTEWLVKRFVESI